MYRHRLPEPCGQVFPVCSDLGSEELLAAPLRGVHTVVHLAWENNFLGPATDITDNPEDASNRTRNIATLKNLIGAMEKARIRRLIFVSAFGVDRKAEDAFLAEKYVGEFCVLNSMISEKFIVRPTVVYGGEEVRNQFMGAVRRLLRFPGFYPVPSWKESVYPLNLSDFVEVISGLVRWDCKDQPVRILEVSGQDGYRVEEILRLISGRDGRGTRIPLGSFLGRSLLPLVEKNFGGGGVRAGIRSFLNVSGRADPNENSLKGICGAPKRKFAETMKSVSS